jgi:hypothetical protein
MIQFGKNSGARHVSYYGNASSIVNKDKYTDAEIFERDNAVLGILAMCHHKFLTHMPTEVVEEHLSALKAAGYGCNEMAADGIPEGIHCSSFLLLLLT